MSSYILSVIFVAYFCSAFFWSLASASVALSTALGKITLHLALGFFLQFFWFGIVCVWGIINIFKKPKQPQIPVVATQPVSNDWNTW